MKAFFTELEGGGKRAVIKYCALPTIPYSYLCKLLQSELTLAYLGNLFFSRPDRFSNP